MPSQGPATGRMAEIGALCRAQGWITSPCVCREFGVALRTASMYLRGACARGQIVWRGEYVTRTGPRGRPAKIYRPGYTPGLRPRRF